MKLLSEIIGPRAERTLQRLSDIDQGIKRNAAGEVIKQELPNQEVRGRLQRRFAKAMSNPENRAAVIDPKKMGKQGRDAVFTLTQHSDRNIGMQKAVHADMKKLDPENPRNYFLGDRIDQNQAARKIVVQKKLEDRKAASLNPNAPRERSPYSGKTSREIVGNMRVPNRPEFNDPKQIPTTAKAAMEIEKKHGNDLVVQSANKADKERGIVDRLSRPFTQPSHATNIDDYSLNKFGKAVKSVEKVAPKSVLDTIKTTAAEYAPKLSGALGTVGRIASNPVVGGIMTAMEPTPANAGENEFERQKKYSPKTP